MHTQTHITVSVSEVLLAEVKATRTMLNIVTLYLITFSQAVMNVVAVLSARPPPPETHTYLHLCLLSVNVMFIFSSVHYLDSLVQIFCLSSWISSNLMYALTRRG